MEPIESGGFQQLFQLSAFGAILHFGALSRYRSRLAFLPAKSGHVRGWVLTHPENKTSTLEKRRKA
jgi:hypothetical protein